MTETMTATTTINHWINGVLTESTSGNTAPVYNPATGELTGQVVLASQEEIDTAIKTAKAAAKTWGALSIARRQAIIFNFRELLNARRGELAAIITAEHGKVLSDALGEILRGQEVVELATGFPHLLKGAFNENASTGVDVFSFK